MDMSYDGVLVMPSNYAVMDEEEMTYVDGGIAIPNWLVGGAIDAVISLVVLGGIGAATSFFKGQSKKYGAKAAGLIFSKNLKRKLIAKKIASGVAAGICSVASACFTVLTWATDPGGQLAKAIDNRDCKPGNGFCNF